MCEFFSFIVKSDPQAGLQVLTAPDLCDHGNICELHNLDGVYDIYYECEWDSAEDLEIRLGTGVSEALGDQIETWIRSNWSERQTLVNQQILLHLRAGAMAEMAYFCHENWNERTERLYAADCAERVLPVLEDKPELYKAAKDMIAQARACARGEIKYEELFDVRHAAWDVLEKIELGASGLVNGKWDAFVSATIAAQATDMISAHFSAMEAFEKHLQMEADPYSLEQNSAVFEKIKQERTWQVNRVLEYIEGKAG